MIRKLVMILLIGSIMFFTSGCLSRATKDHLHTKISEVEVRTQQLVEDNSDQVVAEILKKLDQRLIEKGIEIPEELKEILIAEAQMLAREYAAKGVEVGFKEIHQLVDKLFPGE